MEKIIGEAKHWSNYKEIRYFADEGGHSVRMESNKLIGCSYTFQKYCLGTFTYKSMSCSGLNIMHQNYYIIIKMLLMTKTWYLQTKCYILRLRIQRFLQKKVMNPSVVWKSNWILHYTSKWKTKKNIFCGMHDIRALK